MVALADLIQPQSASAIISTQLALLQTLGGFPVNSWQQGSVPLALIQADASTLASLSTTISNIASGGLVSLATGGWLDLIALSHYGLTRKPAAATVGTIILTDTQSAGPFTITAGQLIISNGTTGQTYQNTTAGTLLKGSTLSLTWTAQTPGIAGNATVGSTWTMVTALPGVTVTNPANANSSDWITTQGADAELDASLVLRCQARWPGLGGGTTSLVYQAAAIASSNTITRAGVVGGNGSVTVYVAGANGGSGAADVAVAQAAITAMTPLCVTSTVLPANNLSIPVSGNYRVTAALLTSATQAVSKALIAYAGTVAIGGTVLVNKVVQTIMDQAGVLNVTLTAPAVDVALGSNQVAVFDTSLLTFTGV